MSRKTPLAQQVVVVTGASAGLGRAVARLAASRGARVVAVARDPAPGHVASLNAAVAGSIALYEIFRQRGWAGAAGATPPDAPAEE